MACGVGCREALEFLLAAREEKGGVDDENLAANFYFHRSSQLHRSLSGTFLEEIITVSHISKVCEYRIAVFPLDWKEEGVKTRNCCFGGFTKLYQFLS